MGCASSRSPQRRRAGRRFSILRGARGSSHLQLPISKLSFSEDQLAELNHYFNEQLDNRENDLDHREDVRNGDKDEHLHSLVERLVQRLICTVGTLDPRFASMLLINTADPISQYNKGSGGLRLSYLLRLDRLSTPATFDEDDDGDDWGPRGGRPVCVVCEGGPEGGGTPHGFAKIRLQGDGLHKWAEFVNNNGYLRRDRVQERFVELLAQAAARCSGEVCQEPSGIDESRLCGAPGKVMPDALVANRILHTPPPHRLYYGPPVGSNAARFPDARHFRIAIVEGGVGGGGASVRMRVAPLFPHQRASADEDVRVSLTLGVEASGWPRSADFPLRVPLVHPLAPIYQQAATTGFYLVPCAPHPSTRCDDRSSVWQLHAPAAESQLMAAADCTAVRTLATLAAILADLRRTTVSGGRACSSHLLATVVWFAQEQNGDVTPPTPLQMMHNWHRSRLSTHVLKCVDQLIGALQSQRQQSYFFPWLNVVLNSADSGASGGHFTTEEDFLHDAQLLQTYLTRLHAVSLSPRLTHRMTGPAQDTQGAEGTRVGSALLERWSRLLTDMAPSKRHAYRPSHTSSESAFTTRQVNYIGQLLRGMLLVKTLTLSQSENHMPSWSLCEDSSAEPTTPLSDWTSCGSEEDVVYLLSAILDQAKQLQQKGGRVRTPPSKMDAAYQSAVHCLMQQVRSNCRHLPPNDDVTLVREVLHWLYVAAELAGKQLAPVVRPFLDQLMTVSHQNSWHTDLCQRQTEASRQEAHALSQFCALVNCAGLRPRDGLIDALRKGWNWAGSVVETASRLEEGVELVFTPQDGATVRHRITVINSNSQQQQRHQNQLTTRSLGRPSHYNHTPNTTLPRAVSRQHSLSLHESLAARFREAVDGAGGVCSGGDDQWRRPATAHSYLRANSPMTVVMATAKQNYSASARLRCCSSYVDTIVYALIALNKFTILQEVASLLPEDQRSQTLDDIRRMTRERRRTHSQQRAATHNSCSSQHSANHTRRRSLVGIDSTVTPTNQQLSSRNNRITQSCQNMTAIDDNYATYRSLDELSLKVADDKNPAAADQLIDQPPNLAGTLLGTCRLARSRQNLAGICWGDDVTMPTLFNGGEGEWVANQPLLALTDDNRLTLRRPRMQQQQGMQQRMQHHLQQQAGSKKKEMVTKL